MTEGYEGIFQRNVTNILAANAFQERTKPICNLGQDSFIVVARYTV